MEQATEQTTALLARIPLFTSLPEQEAQALITRMYTRRFRKSEAIIHIDDSASSFFVIRSGEVKVVRPLLTGEEVVVGILGSGDFFGEMALLDGKPRSASVFALEPTECLVLSRDDFLTYLHMHPRAAIEILVVLADRIRNLNAQVEEAMLDLPHRLARRLADLARRRGIKTAEGVRINVPITQAELAGMVRASRQRVNRLLGEWQMQQIVRLGRRGEIVILKPRVIEELTL
jgi:CRP/FNR family transcriptional regulator, cyclic AMP receptor protein